MPETVQGILLGFLVLATSIWVGGYVAVAVVSRTAATVIDPADRVNFFRALGRAYLVLQVPSLLVALGTGYALLSQRSWNGVATAATVLAAALVVTLAWGVVQARRMGRVRRAALAAPDSADSADRADSAGRQEAVRRGARRAALLRAGLGVLSLALIALGSLLATT
jgi:uncharacterized membrane protein